MKDAVLSRGGIALAFFLSVFLPWSGLAQSAPSTKKLSAADIIAMIPQSMDNLDPIEERNRKQLVVMGAAAYPALCSEMLKSDDESYIGNIISILVNSEGDKTLPRKALKDLAGNLSFPSERDPEVLRAIIASALGKIGTSDDTPTLIGLLSDSSDIVRTRSLRSLEKIGTARDINAIQTWLTAWKASISAQEQVGDPSISAGETAIEEIRKREAEKGSGVK